MLKSERKRIILGHIDPVLKPAGYKLRHTGGTCYYLDQNGLTISWVLIFYSLGDVQSQGVRVTHQEVEEILQRIINEKHLCSWDIHRQTLLTPTIQDKTLVDAFRSVYIESEAQADVVATSYLDYILGAGKDFVEHYSYLPNVLKRMDKLLEAGLTWQHPDKGILSGSLDAEFRGLIISKLCNDPNFGEKLEECDRVFAEVRYQIWLPYYEKLKAEVLPTIEPQYNI